MPPPIEAAPNLIRAFGAEELAKSIYLTTYRHRSVKVKIDWEEVLMAFKPPRVESPQREESVLEIPRSVIALVTHEYPEASRMRMMEWIPQIKEKPDSIANIEKKVFRAFGIDHLKNFANLEGKFWIRGSIPPTEMRLRGINGLWIFESYNRRERESFDRLRETLWVIAMLPKPVIEEALEKRHFLLVSERIDRSFKLIRPTIAGITEGVNRIVVEDFNRELERKYEEGEIEKDTSVVLFRYH